MELLPFGSSPFLGIWREGWLLSSQWGFSVPQTDKANIMHQNIFKHNFPFLKHQKKTNGIFWQFRKHIFLTCSKCGQAATLGLEFVGANCLLRIFCACNFKAGLHLSKGVILYLLLGLWEGWLILHRRNNIIQVFSFQSPKFRFPVHKESKSVQCMGTWCGTLRGACLDRFSFRASGFGKLTRACPAHKGGGNLYTV